MHCESGLSTQSRGGCCLLIHLHEKRDIQIKWKYTQIEENIYTKQTDLEGDIINALKNKAILTKGALTYVTKFKSYKKINPGSGFYNTKGKNV